MSSSECVGDDDKGGGGKRNIIMFGKSTNESSDRLNLVGNADNDDDGNGGGERNVFMFNKKNNEFQDRLGSMKNDPQKKASTASVEKGVYSDAEEDDGPDIFATDKNEAARLKKIEDDKKAARLWKIEENKKEAARLKKIEDDKKTAKLKKIENDKKAKEADAERERILKEKRVQNAAELEAKKISDQELISQLENMKGARNPIEYIVDNAAVMYAWEGRTELLAVSVERKGNEDWCQDDMSQRFWKRKAIMRCLKEEKITLIRMTEDNPGFASLQAEVGEVKRLPCVIGFTFDKTKKNGLDANLA